MCVGERLWLWSGLPLYWLQLLYMMALCLLVPAYHQPRHQSTPCIPSECHAILDHGTIGF